MSRMKKVCRILVSLRLAYASNRAFLAGIARFRRRHPDWRVTVSENFADFRASDLVSFANYDGIITAQPQSDEAKRTLGRCRIPVAVIGHEDSDVRFRRTDTVFVRGAAAAVGTLAAKHFASLGAFNSYAFIHTSTEGSWSEARARGFCAELRRRHLEAEVIRTGYADGSKRDLEELTRRISRLAKPTAVFAAYDNRALQAFEACEAAEVAIPSEASVIGVDNDTTLCDFANPSLTSIAIDQKKMGETAAEWLNRLITRRTGKVKSVAVTDATVVERESTAPVIPAKHLADRARGFIEQNACSGITAGDVVAYLGVSRALADRRFKAFTGRTLNDEINRVKTEAVKQLLTNTNLAIYRITERCGFAAPQYAKRLFKRLTGMTMRDFRARRRTS